MSSLLSKIRLAIHARKMRRKYPLTVIHEGVVVGAGCDLRPYVTVFSNVRLWNSNVGRYSYIQEDSTCFNSEIGAFCSIAAGVSVGLAAHPTTLVSSSPVFYDNQQPLPKFFVDKPIVFENLPRTIVGADVWIGQGVMIKAGINVGVGAVVGAGAIVTRDVPPYTIVAGNPARSIRLRFSNEICKRLLATCWWNFEDSELERLAPYFTSPEKLLEQLEIGQ